MGYVPPPPPMPGESAPDYRRRMNKWHAAQGARNSLTLLVIWVAFLIFLLIALIVWATSGAGG